MTPEQQIKAIYPASYCTLTDDGTEYEIWCRVDGDLYEVVGAGLTPEAAWNNALPEVQRSNSLPVG